MPKPVHKVRAIFLEAVDAATLEERVALLDRACAEDPALREELDALLRAHERPDPLLDHPAVEYIGARPDDVDWRAESLGCLAPPLAPESLGRLGDYEVLEVIGRGATGVVFRAFDDKLQRFVAIKLLAPRLAAVSAARQRFSCEARAAAALTDDNVIAIHAVLDAGPVPYIVMQYLGGGSLQEKLDRTGALSLEETLRIGWQIAEGLAAAHQHGLVHRDVKPANILLAASGQRGKLTDFGLAQAFDDLSQPQSEFVAGTPMFMSPEQAVGEPIGCASDLFSLGSVLYTMCTGQPPFRAPTSQAVLKQVCEEFARPIREINPELPLWLGDLLTRLHAKCPADRIASAREVADLLAYRLAGLHATSSAAVIPFSIAAKPNESRFTKLGRRRRAVMVAAVLLSVFAGLGMSEATGVTDFKGRVERRVSPDGTLVVEVNDAGISVEIDGAEIVITGTGGKGIGLKPGRYRFAAGKDGKLVRHELVAASREGPPVAPVSQRTFPASPPL